MRIGLQIPRFTWPGGQAIIGERLTQIARAAEAAGFHSLWVMDHYFQIPAVGKVGEPMLEGYTALSYLAGTTRRARLGTLVSGVIYRQPAFLVKQVTSLDVLSGGRAYMGIGAAWNEREAKGLGFPFPPVRERFEMLDEALQIAKRMWSDEVSRFEGKHYRLEETLNRPQPLSQPHPPIMIGGMGEKKTLRLVAKYADACNLFMRAGIDTLEHKLGVLQRHCDELGRDFGAIEKTSLGTVHLAPDKMRPDDVLDSCRALAEIGIDHAIFNMPNVHEIRPLEVFAENILPEVSAW